jgi:predicted ATPase
MAGKIKKLVLKNFKSIPRAEVTFADLTFFVGRNGSGKSNLTDALTFIAEAMQVPLLTLFRKRAGVTSVAHRIPNADRHVQTSFGIGVTLEDLSGFGGKLGYTTGARGHYAFELNLLGNLIEVEREQCIVELGDRRFWFDRNRENIASSEEFLNKARGTFVAPDSLSMPFIGGLPPFFMVQEVLYSLKTYAIDPRKLKEFQDPDIQQYLLSDGSNATSVLDSLRKSKRGDYERMLEIFGNIVPNISSVQTVRYGPKQSLRFQQLWAKDQSLKFEALSMSDGTLRSFGLLLALFQEKKPSITLIEEPEASMHPAAANVIIELLQQMSHNSQIIVTTHSPDILDNEGISDENLRVVSWLKGETRIGEISENAKSALQRHLSTPGELLRMRALESVNLFEDSIDPQPTLFEDTE